MSKVEMMDRYVDSFEDGITSSEIFKVVYSIFGLDLNDIPVLAAADGSKKDTAMIIESHLNQYEEKVSGPEIRSMINQIFGVNLDAIASLEMARISIYSKDRWMVQQNRDLFVVHTGAGDVDVKILPTSYYTEKTGSKDLPIALKQSLVNLGFYFDKKIGGYYFSNPTGEAIPDEFKGRTMGAIIQVIRNSYSHI